MDPWCFQLCVCTVTIYGHGWVYIYPSFSSRFHNAIFIPNVPCMLEDKSWIINDPVPVHILAILLLSSLGSFLCLFGCALNMSN